MLSDTQVTESSLWKSPGIDTSKSAEFLKSPIKIAFYKLKMLKIWDIQHVMRFQTKGGLNENFASWNETPESCKLYVRYESILLSAFTSRGIPHWCRAGAQKHIHRNSTVNDAGGAYLVPSCKFFPFSDLGSPSWSGGPGSCKCDRWRRIADI